MEFELRAIDIDTVCRLVLLAREYGAKVEPSDDDGSNEADDMMRGVLADRADDPVADQIASLVDDLNIDQQIELVALFWVGRGSFDRSEWREALAEARRAHTPHTAQYLLGQPLLSDHLLAGLEAFGHSCDEG